MNIFNENDIMFFKCVMFNKKQFNKIIKKSLKYKFDFTIETINDNLPLKIIHKKTNKIIYSKIIIFGYTENNKFEWYRNINELIFQHIKKYDFNNNNDTLLKLFNNTQIIFDKKNKKYIDVIPILIALTNPSFNVIRAHNENNDKQIYVLVDKMINDDVNFDIFIDLLNYKFENKYINDEYKILLDVIYNSIK
jgi:hypothetical protein